MFRRGIRTSFQYLRRNWTRDIVSPQSTFKRTLASSLTRNYYQEYSSDSRTWLFQSLVVSVAVLYQTAHAEAVTTDTIDTTAEREWPVIRRAEVAKHNSINDAWVTFQGNVYDMTPFIKNHPGGHEKILLAAGGDLESYWNLYRQHYNSATPMEVLARLQIGVLHEEDVEQEEKAKELAAAQNNNASTDPYDNDPAMSPIMRVLSKQPINAEPPGSLLTDSYITPNEIFFIRNHHPVPHIDPRSFQLQLTIQQGSTAQRQYSNVTSLNLEELKTQYPAVSVTTTIQCGGNRRLEMTDVEKTNGASWQVSAISTAKWTGVSLRQLLLTKIFPAYGLREEDVWQDTSLFQHVHFVGADGMEASIPLRKALRPDGDVLIAYAMNDSTTIPAEHGYPLRAIVPGHVGVRNVKWVQEIRLSQEEAYGTWQRGMAYKGFGPSRKTLDNVDVEGIPSLQEQPVTSAITSVVRKASNDSASTNYSTNSSNTSGDSSRNNISTESLAPGDVVKVQGYAYSGGGRGIVRVDVSGDGGRNWQDATLTQGSDQLLHRAWAWTFWQTDLTVPDTTTTVTTPCGKQKTVTNNQMEIIVKATDAAYNVQPDSVKGIWNLRGINNNAWHRVRLPVLIPAPSVSTCGCSKKQ